MEECVPYHPPNLANVADSRSVFARPRVGLLPERPRGIDIFVDVPFCGTICGFCPFNVYPYDATQARRDLDGLNLEIHNVKALHPFDSLKVGTVWVGGGTPTVMAEEFLDELLTVLSRGSPRWEGQPDRRKSPR